MHENNLLASIVLKRGELINIARKHGLNSEETLKCSQELDNLLNTYQQVIY
ncbi:aspartyl-phosphate phosphatase Spo0E family protein [Halalkalibacter flavus]|jgi:stage 0 sporulation regulatory protein|uniref:aspartyl-phosphate phosphatase Spo0E family protein n=1 Tax=Halalkalibacter flavus TaxID=3090668 RepID=UPI002FC9A038